MARTKTYTITIVGTVDDSELDILVPSGEITIDIYTARGNVYEVRAELVKAETKLKEGE